MFDSSSTYKIRTAQRVSWRTRIACIQIRGKNNDEPQVGIRGRFYLLVRPHVNVLQLLGTVTSATESMIITEFMEQVMQFQASLILPGVTGQIPCQQFSYGYKHNDAICKRDRCWHAPFAFRRQATVEVI